MKIDNVKVYGLAESIVASGLPMVEEYDSKAFAGDVFGVSPATVGFKVNGENAARHIKRAVETLSPFPPGEGHHNFLCGIIVQMNVTAPRYFWPEVQRYSFIDIVSSTSTMHKLKAFVKKYHERKDEDVEKIRSHFSELTDWDAIVNFLIYAWNNIDDIEKLKANLPEGYLQTARITTNYRAMKTCYMQRRTHRLKEWQDFCDWVETLPMSQLITRNSKEKQD